MQTKFSLHYFEDVLRTWDEEMPKHPTGLSHTDVMQTSHDKYSAQWSDKTPKTNKTQVESYLFTYL